MKTPIAAPLSRYAWRRLLLFSGAALFVAAHARRSAASAFLSDDDLVARASLSPVVLVIALYVLSGLLSAGVLGHVAVARGKPRFAWFLAGLFGSVVALALLLPRARGAASALAGLGRVQATRPPAECGTCGAPVHPAALRCAHCGAALTPSVESETRRVANPHALSERSP